MTALLLLIPLSLTMAAFALIAFVWSVRSGQLEDLAAPAGRMLVEDTVASTSEKAKSSTASDLQGGSVPKDFSADSALLELLHK